MRWQVKEVVVAIDQEVGSALEYLEKALFEVLKELDRGVEELSRRLRFS